MTAVFRFNPSELYQELPGPGYYGALIMAAQCCHSTRGNPMLKVSYQLLRFTPNGRAGPFPLHVRWHERDRS